MKIIPITLTAILLLGSTIYADDDRYERKRPYLEEKSKDAALYRQECGACHMAYQPGFLPRRSWKKTMATLADHFETDASLDEQDRKAIEAYLLRNASDAKYIGGDIGKMGRKIPDTQTPLRISETPYFKKEHRKIPKRLVRQKEVRSFANCTACHRKAEKGEYGERSLIIPNYGRWDD